MVVVVRKQADAEGSPSRVFPPALARGVGLPHVPAGFTARGREKVLECSMTTPSFCSEDARPPQRDGCHLSAERSLPHLAPRPAFLQGTATFLGSWSLPRIPGRKEGVLGPRPAHPPVARAARALRLLEMQLLHLSRVTCPAPVLDFSISISLFLQVVEDADGKEDRQTSALQRPRLFLAPALACGGLPPFLPASQPGP